MTRSIAILTGVLCLAGSGFAADDPARFAGEWKTSMGPVTLEQSGDAVTGSLVAYKLAIQGKIKGQELSASYDEGQLHVDAILTLDPSGNAFQGTFRASNQNRGVWNGWRPDPAAAAGEPADFSGLWLTDLGLMELAKDGPKFKGRYALRGTSSIEGAAKGRHLDFTIKAMRTGPGWFDLDPKGQILAGAGGTDGLPGWYGWKGRKATEYARHAALVPGKIIDGSTDGLLTCTVRAPESYKPDDGKKWPTVLMLHGSNMNAKAYVSTLAAAWPEIARDYLLIGINGELPSNISAESPAFNYTYINFVGRSTFGGFPGTDRESPALVREAIEELKKVYPVKHYFVGGHSQGGFLTYSLLMNSPESIAGAFPVSGGLIFQCEPSAYADPTVRAAQRAVPLAIVHAKNDPVVPFNNASYAAGLFGDSGWPAFRLFADENAGHMFGRLPVGPAIRWLEAMASDDPAALLDFAERRLAESSPRDAIAAANRARGLALDPAMTERLARLDAAIADRASPKAAEYLEAIRADKDGSWADGFLAFRDDYEFAAPARDVMAAFDALRVKQSPPAKEAIDAARVAFRQGRRDEGMAKAKEVVEKYYASPSYRLAKGWLAEPR